jgi:hypothetical protein
MKKIFTLILLIGLLLSCEEIVTEEKITSETVVLLAPANDVTIGIKQEISFNWEALSGATSYQLQVAKPNFASAVQIKLDTLINETGFSLDSLPKNNYEWRVRALNSTYKTAYFSNEFVVEK